MTAKTSKTAKTQPEPVDADTITERVRERYAGAALQVLNQESACCAPSTGATNCCSGDPFGADLSTGNYAAADLALLPEEAALASLGCGNPTALIDLRAGETVLDLGSGGGIDVLLSARRVGPTGFVYGLDMTDEMLALALANKAKAGATNVAFLKGRIEEIPLPANSVDVVISNCVINLSADKGQVLARGVPRAHARRPLRGLRCHRRWPCPSGVAAEYGSLGGLPRRGDGD